MRTGILHVSGLSWSNVSKEAPSLVFCLQLYAEMAASREALARMIDPDTKKRKFEELDEMLEGASMLLLHGRHGCLLLSTYSHMCGPWIQISYRD